MSGASGSRKRSQWKTRLFLVLATTSTSDAFAQAVPPSGTAGPDAVPQPLPPYASPPPSLAPPVAPPPSVGPQVSSIIFDDIEITPDGTAGVNAVPRHDWLPPSEPESGFVLYHRVGEPLNSAWVRNQFAANGLLHAAARADRFLALIQLINRAYLSAGLINSGLLVGDQSTARPTVLKLRLVMGRLVSSSAGPAMQVDWKDGHSGGLSRSYVRHRLEAGNRQPLNAVELEREFRLLASDPAIRTINADLRPGSQPGEAALELIVAPQYRYDIYGSYANDRSPAVGGERGAVGGFFRNLLSPGDILTAEFGATHGLKDGLAGYVTPLVNPRTSLSIRGSFNNAAVIDSALAPLDIRSRDRSGEVGLREILIDKPLTPTNVVGNWHAAQTLSVGISVAHRRSESFLFGLPFSFSPGFVNGHSHYTVARLNGDYIWRSVRRVLAASVTLSRGVGGTRSDVPGVPTPKRGFMVVLAQLNAAQKLNESGLELRARITAQYANSVLYAGERISAGGQQTVRGYRENLLLADRGVIGSLELVQPLMLTASRPGAKFRWGSFAVSAFTEGAYVGNVDVDNPEKRRIYSVGASLSWTPSDAILANVSYGHALVNVRPSRARDLQDRGINFRVTIRPLMLLRH